MNAGRNIILDKEKQRAVLQFLQLSLFLSSVKFQNLHNIYNKILCDHLVDDLLYQTQDDEQDY